MTDESFQTNRLIVEVTYPDGTSRERLQEILGFAVYRADKAYHEPLDTHERHDWETLNDGTAFTYTALTPDHGVNKHTGSNDYRDLMEAFMIFAKYPNEYHDISRAEHDEIWAGPDPEVVSTEDKLRLEELGWNDYGDGGFHHFV